MDTNSECKKLDKEKLSKKYFGFLFLVIILFSSIVFFSFFLNKVEAADLLNRKLFISDSRESETSVDYDFEWSGQLSTLRCVKILFCVEQIGGCNTPSGFDSTGVSKGSWSGLTASSWNLDNTTNGTLKLTNNAGEAPVANVALGFSGLTNPSVSGTFNARIATYSDMACLTEVDSGPATLTILGSGISITSTVPSPPPPYATVILKGKAYPNAFITILRDASVASAFQAPSSGYFSKTLTGIDEGIYTFGIWAEDTKGRKSITLSFTVNLVAGVTTTISGIFLPPTIEISETTIKKGKVLEYKGQSYPFSIINISVFSDPITKKTTAGGDGKWNYGIDTSLLARGAHTTKTKAQTSDGEQSTFSETLSFQVVHACSGADLNGDGKVNLVDFSILLYWWGRHNECADQDSNEVVDLIDFSIMMYYWTG